MNLEPARQAFIAESQELLVALEKALLALESSPENKELLVAAFRSAHTIKGSAGVFGLESVVDFTHLVEGVLERVRDGALKVNSDLIELLLACCDHVSELIGQSEEEGKEIAQGTLVAGRALVERLKTHLAPEGAAAPLPPLALAAGPEVQDAQVESVGGGRVASDTWHISLRFGRDVLRNGMDPMSFIRYLGTLGTSASTITLFDGIPEAKHMDPESCYLGMEIEFRSDADKETISGVFDFVRDDSMIHILPPHSRILEYIELIEKLPEDKKLLGEMLVKSGALTQPELEEGLALQKQQAAGSARGEHQALGRILVDQGMVQPELVDAALEKQRTNKESAAQEANFIRVRADKLDELITLVGELVIASAGVNLVAQRAAHGELIETASTLARLVEEVRDGALKLRMVPIGETFNRFNRVVRDLGHDLGKDVELILSGTETELDKSMVEKISDPLMHLVRNALDHGIERPELRRERGKPPRGRLRLNAYHESGSIVIEVADDGRGLERKRILARAADLGLATSGQNPTDQEIHRFIMEPGFSTADQVTSVSGRGIGMDVVRRNVEALRGSIDIDGAEGEGTIVAIRLPLTLAIIDGFAVGVGPAAYVLPLETVLECMELAREERAKVRESGYINLRNEVLPLLRLRDVFEVRGESAKRENVVVVQYGGQRAGFIVDALMGEFQTVIKPLGKLFERLSGISGSTILGTGEVALILDVQALVARAAGGRERNMQRQSAEENQLERK